MKSVKEQFVELAETKGTGIEERDEGLFTSLDNGVEKVELALDEVYMDFDLGQKIGTIRLFQHSYSDFVFNEVTLLCEEIVFSSESSVITFEGKRRDINNRKERIEVFVSS